MAKKNEMSVFAATDLTITSPAAGSKLAACTVELRGTGVPRSRVFVDVCQGSASVVGSSPVGVTVQDDGTWKATLTICGPGLKAGLDVMVRVSDQQIGGQTVYMNLYLTRDCPCS